MFGKHFASMYSGSMFGQSAVVFAVWGYVIAHMRPSRKDGACHVELNSTLLAAMFSSTPEQIMAAITTLMSPDEKSRSYGEGGRRLILTDDTLHAGPVQFRVVNGAVYRSMRDEEERRVYLTEAKRRSRESAGLSTKSTMSTAVNRRPPPSSQAEAEAEAEAETNSSVVSPKKQATETDTNRFTTASPSSVVSVAVVKPKSWTAEACDDWIEAYGGTAPGARIGKALRPLVEKVAKKHGIEFPASWLKVRPWWQRYLEQTEAKFASAESFAQKPRQVVEGSKKAEAHGRGVDAAIKGGLRDE